MKLVWVLHGWLSDHLVFDCPFCSIGCGVLSVSGSPRTVVSTFPVAFVCVCVFDGRPRRIYHAARFQVKETSSLHLLFGLPKRGVRYSLGYQMFGFREKPPQQQRRQQPQRLLRAAPFETESSIATATASLTVAGDASETTWVAGGSPQRGRGGAAAGGGGMPLATASERGRSLTDASGFGDDTTGTFFSGAAPSLLAGGSLHGGPGRASIGGGGDGDGGGGRRDALADAPTRGRVRLSGFGHVGLGGSLALCDPASGLAFAMVTNKVGWFFLPSFLFFFVPSRLFRDFPCPLAG